MPLAPTNGSELKPWFSTRDGIAQFADMALGLEALHRPAIIRQIQCHAGERIAAAPLAL